jgi:hypothetical protein
MESQTDGNGEINRSVQLEQMLVNARRSTEDWNDFLQAFVHDEELIARVKAKSPR